MFPQTPEATKPCFIHQLLSSHTPMLSRRGEWSAVQMEVQGRWQCMAHDTGTFTPIQNQEETTKEPKTNTNNSKPNQPQTHKPNNPQMIERIELPVCEPSMGWHPWLTHFNRDRWSARSYKSLSSSNSEYLPIWRALLKISPSMLFARQSANIALPFNHRSRQFSSRRSRISRHSSVGLCSVQVGVDVFVDIS